MGIYRIKYGIERERESKLFLTWRNLFSSIDLTIFTYSKTHQERHIAIFGLWPIGVMIDVMIGNLRGLLYHLIFCESCYNCFLLLSAISCDRISISSRLIWVQVIISILGERISPSCDEQRMWGFVSLDELFVGGDQ